MGLAPRLETCWNLEAADTDRTMIGCSNAEACSVAPAQGRFGTMVRWVTARVQVHKPLPLLVCYSLQVSAESDPTTNHRTPAPTLAVVDSQW